VIDISPVVVVPAIFDIVFFGFICREHKSNALGWSYVLVLFNTSLLDVAVILKIDGI
jgi:hypothetical protein